MKNLTIKIEGMSCNHCVMNVTHILKKIESLKIIDVQVNEAKVEVDDTPELRTQLSDSFARMGYKITEILNS